MKTDAFTYGTWIARFMGNRASKAEIERLTAWINSNDDNMQLFEFLIDKLHANAARKWFKEAGVNTRFIKWVDSEKFPSEIKAERQQKRLVWVCSVVAIIVLAYLYAPYFVNTGKVSPGVASPNKKTNEQPAGDSGVKSQERMALPFK